MSAYRHNVENNVLVFRLLPELFAIHLAGLTEVLQVTEIAHLPGMPSYVSGVFHRRGRIIPAVNLKLFFNFPKPGLTPLNKILLVQSAKLSFGILADDLEGLATCDASDLRQPAIDSFSGSVAGIFDQNILLLDLELLAVRLFGSKTDKL